MISVFFSSEAYEASCQKVLSGNLTECLYRHNHVAIVSTSRGLEKLAEIRSKLEKKEGELKCSVDTLISKSKLRLWATEQYN